MAYTCIDYEVEDATATIALNNPEQRNALGMDMREEVADALARCRDDAAVRAVVLTGRGGAFCAGGDLKSLREGADRALATRRRIKGLHTWFADLVAFDKPVVAAVDGPALGAGFSLALAADAIVCTPRSRFCQVFGRIGVIPDMGSLYLLPRRIGLPRARDLIFTARNIGAREALAIGLVREIIDEARLASAARSLASTLGSLPPEAFAVTKDALNHAFERPSVGDLLPLRFAAAAASGLAPQQRPPRDPRERP